MNGRIASVLVAVGLMAASIQAQPTPQEVLKRLKNEPPIPARHVSGKPEGLGTVQYDPGAPADAFLSGLTPSFLFGNRFDTRNGSPLSFPGTATGISWYQGASGFFPTALALLYALPLGAYSPASGVSVGSVSFFAFNSVPVAWPVASSRFVGIRAQASPGGAGYFGSVGMRSASYNSQGFHGIRRTFNGAVSNNLPGQNVMVRVTGDIIIPVELLEFEIE